MLRSLIEIKKITGMKKCEQMPCPQTGLCLSTVLQAITVHQSNKHKGQLLSV